MPTRPSGVCNCCMYESRSVRRHTSPRPCLPCGSVGGGCLGRGVGSCRGALFCLDHAHLPGQCGEIERPAADSSERDVNLVLGLSDTPIFLRKPT